MQTTYRWTSSLPLPPSVVMTRKDLYIPANTLPANSVASLQLRAWLSADPGRTSTAVVNVTCGMQPVVCRVDPGGTVEVSVSTTLTLSGAQSFDPDNVAGESVAYTWSCQQYASKLAADASASGVTCVLRDSVTTWTSVQLILRNGSLVSDVWYGFTLLFQKGSSRNATSRVIVHPMDLTIPVVLVSAPVSPVSYTQKLILSATINPDTNVGMQWSVVSASIGTLALDSTTLLSASVTSRTLVLRANVLAPGGVYVFRADAWMLRNASQRGGSEVRLSAVRQPCCGVCSVSPANGTELETSFQFQCTSFAEGEQPVLYQYATRTGGMVDRTWLQPVMQSSSWFASVLGAGQESEGYVRHVIVVVTGPYGESSEQAVSVTVRPKANMVKEEDKLSFVSEILNSTVSDAVKLQDTELVSRVVASLTTIVRSTESAAEVAAAASARRTDVGGEQKPLQCPPSCGHGECVWTDSIPLCQCEEGFAGTVCNTTKEVDNARKRVQEQFLSAIETAANQTAVTTTAVFEGYLDVVHSCLSSARQVPDLFVLCHPVGLRVFFVCLCSEVTTTAAATGWRVCKTALDKFVFVTVVVSIDQGRCADGRDEWMDLLFHRRASDMADVSTGLLDKLGSVAADRFVCSDRSCVAPLE